MVDAMLRLVMFQGPLGARDFLNATVFFKFWHIPVLPLRRFCTKPNATRQNVSRPTGTLTRGDPGPMNVLIFLPFDV